MDIDDMAGLERRAVNRHERDLISMVELSAPARPAGMTSPAIVTPTAISRIRSAFRIDDAPFVSGAGVWVYYNRSIHVSMAALASDPVRPPAGRRQ